MTHPLDIPLRALTAAAGRGSRDDASQIGSFRPVCLPFFPIILGSSIVIMHPRIGGKATASMMRTFSFR